MTAFEVEALLMSLQGALIALLIATPLAVVLASPTARGRRRGRPMLDTLILLPMGLPPAVVGFGLLVTLGGAGAQGAWLKNAQGLPLPLYPAGAVLAATLTTVPLMVRLLRPAFEAADPLMLPVARTLGASRLQGWWTITLPMAWPAVASSMALGLAAAWGQSCATLVLAAALRLHHVGESTAPVAMAQVLLGAANGTEGAKRLALMSLGIALAAIAVGEIGRRHWRRRWRSRLRPVRQPARA